MAELPSLIKFRLLAAMLNDEEFSVFLCKFNKKLGRDVIMTTLFNHFSARNAGKSSDQNVLDSVIEIITGILEQREKEPSTDLIPLQIESLSSALIGNIASYLDQEDHIDLSKCSRWMYSGCNTPNTLQWLDVDIVGNRSLLNLHRYSQIRCIDISLRQFKDLVFSSNQTVFPRLTQMRITNGANAKIDWLLNCTAIQFDGITHLHLVAFVENGEKEDSQDTITKTRFLKLLSKFPKLINLTLCHIRLMDNFDSNDDHLWNDLLPELKVFVDDGIGEDFACSIIRSRSNQLKMVSLKSSYDELPRDLPFGSLEELQCDLRLEDDTMEIARRSLKSLRRLKIDVNRNSTEKEMQLISDAFAPPKRFDEFLVSTPISKLGGICTSLERGIFNLADTAMERLQLKLWVWNDETKSASEIIFQVSRVLNRLFESTIDDYLVSWKSEIDTMLPNEEKWNMEIGRMIEKNKSRFDVSFSKRNLLISRKDSKIAGCIQGYMRDGWLLNE